jgi:hypothetical protein
MISFIVLSLLFGILVCIGIFALYFAILMAEYFAIVVMGKITISQDTPETRKAFAVVSKR